MVSIAQDNIDTCSEALERSIVNMDVENMPLFEVQPVAKVAEAENQMLLESDKSGQNAANDIPDSVDKNDENIERAGKCRYDYLTLKYRLTFAVLNELSNDIAGNK